VDVLYAAAAHSRFVYSVSQRYQSVVRLPGPSFAPHAPLQRVQKIQSGLRDRELSKTLRTILGVSFRRTISTEVKAGVEAYAQLVALAIKHAEHGEGLITDEVRASMLTPFKITAPLHWEQATMLVLRSSLFELWLRWRGEFLMMPADMHMG
jgi:hypothetical protein